MTYQIISKLNTLHRPVLGYGPGNIENLTSGRSYYSVSSTKTPIEEQPDFFILYFPKSPIIVKAISIVPAIDVYPIKWSISVSHDNNSYTTLIDSDKPICHDWYDIYNESLCCGSTEKITFSVPDTSKQTHPSSFFKFQLANNTYYEEGTRIFSKLIYFRRFEIIGSFYVQFPPITYISRFRFYSDILFLSILLI